MSYGTVYILRAGDQDLWKIGQTTLPVEQRIKALQTGCPWPLSLYASIASYFPQRLEKLLHRMLKYERVQGEWFAAEASVIDNVLQAPRLDENPWQFWGDPRHGVSIAPTRWQTDHRDGRPLLSARCLTRGEVEHEVYRLIEGLFHLLDDFKGRI